jgi:hypothetical protein
MNESLKMSLASQDISEWFMDCEADTENQKIPHVILNDKLMTDAIFGTIPIKTEHSYSLTSDGDSMPDSPSDTSKIEGKNDKLLLISKTVTKNIFFTNVNEFSADSWNLISIYRHCFSNFLLGSSKKQVRF